MTSSATNDVVVMGIWGRAGGDGILGLIKELASRLASVAVPAENIVSMSWNPDHSDSAFKAPDTGRHLEAVHALSATPTNTSVVRHGFGDRPAAGATTWLTSTRGPQPAPSSRKR